MTQTMTRSTTGALVVVFAAVALLLTAPLGIAALETNAMTGPTMRAFEGTPVGQVVSFFGADADAAVSRSTQVGNAYGQASFFCFAWQCRSYYRMTATWTGSKLKTTWHLNNPRNMLGHGTCTRYANMTIWVDSTGHVSSGLNRCA
jgi:hypothetical protein